MQTKIRKNIQKIILELGNLGKIPKALIKFGSFASMLLLVLGTVLVILNGMVFSYDAYFELIATTIVKSSFTILAEVIIGGLIIDFVFKKG